MLITFTVSQNQDKEENEEALRNYLRVAYFTHLDSLFYLKRH